MSSRSAGKDRPARQDRPGDAVDDFQHLRGLAVIDLAHQENSAAPYGLAIEMSIVLRNAEAGQGFGSGTRGAEIAAQVAEEARSGRAAGCGRAAGTVAGNPELAPITGGAEFIENLLG